ncbi:MAG: GIY-YIG nuclease family protein [Gemmatimonadaceae bacterium]
MVIRCQKRPELSMRQFAVYILASRNCRLYIGVTNNLSRRLEQHRLGTHGFTARYRINRLVHYELTGDVRAAIEREKELKGWRRDRKIQLIETTNPGWHDLSPQAP